MSNTRDAARRTCKVGEYVPSQQCIAPIDRPPSEDDGPASSGFTRARHV
jgi:hypothetical protein